MNTHSIFDEKIVENYPLTHTSKPGVPFLGHRQNSADPDQTPPKVVSDQGLHSLLTGISITNMIKMTQVHQTPLN